MENKIKEISKEIDKTEKKIKFLKEKIKMAQKRGLVNLTSIYKKEIKEEQILLEDLEITLGEMITNQEPTLLDINIFYLEEYILGEINNHDKEHKDNCLIQGALYIVGELPY